MGGSIVQTKYSLCYASCYVLIKGQKGNTRLQYIHLSSVMATTYQSLPNSPKTTVHSSKTLCLVFSLSTLLVSSSLFLVSHVKSQQRTTDTSASRSLIPLQRSLENYMQQISTAIQVANKLKNQVNGHRDQAALSDCLELMDLSIDRVTDSVIALANSTTLSHADAHAWLSAVLTNHVTCLDGLHQFGQLSMVAVLQDLISRGNALLAVLSSNTSPALIEDILMPLEGKLPSWVKLRERKLLQSLGKEIEANAVVAQDGSGKYTTVADAIAAAPNKSESRYVIYVKEGTYKENVEVGKKQKNIMIVGDGMNSTIITGSLNYVDGTTTFRSATLGKDF